MIANRFQEHQWWLPCLERLVPKEPGRACQLACRWVQGGNTIGLYLIKDAKLPLWIRLLALSAPACLLQEAKGVRLRRRLWRHAIIIIEASRID